MAGVLQPHFPAQNQDGKTSRGLLFAIGLLAERDASWPAAVKFKGYSRTRALEQKVPGCFARGHMNRCRPLTLAIDQIDPAAIQDQSQIGSRVALQGQGTLIDGERRGLGYIRQEVNLHTPV